MSQHRQIHRHPRTTRRLAHAILFAAARGAATTTGSALAAYTLWWITHH